jgi:hypothetical protein
MRIVEAAGAAGASAVLGTFYETGVGIAAVLRIAAAVRAMPAASSGRGASGGPSRPGQTGGAVEGQLGLEPAQGLATAGVLVHDLLRVPLPIDKGRMAVPATVELDRSEIDRYTLERFEARG